MREHALVTRHDKQAPFVGLPTRYPAPHSMRNQLRDTQQLAAARLKGCGAAKSLHRAAAVWPLATCFLCWVAPSTVWQARAKRSPVRCTKRHPMAVATGNTRCGCPVPPNTALANRSLQNAPLPPQSANGKHTSPTRAPARTIPRPRTPHFPNPFGKAGILLWTGSTCPG